MWLIILPKKKAETLTNNGPKIQPRVLDTLIKDNPNPLFREFSAIYASLGEANAPLEILSMILANNIDQEDGNNNTVLEMKANAVG